MKNKANCKKNHFIFHQDGESDCWPMACPPLRCSHQILLPNNCCPTCINLLPNDCIQGNASNTSPNTSCMHLNQMYQNGESWPLVETSSGHGGKTYSSNLTGCASCKCKVLYNYP